MGEIMEFPGNKKDQPESCEKSAYSEFEENTAINRLSRERFDYIMNLKRRDPAYRYSEAYKSAFDALRASSKVDIAEMLNNATETEINLKPRYFFAAFNILCE